ncbi:MAG: hypothetical protein ACAH59_01680 [Pseudobdellovibrionaceae bacterium]
MALQRISKWILGFVFFIIGSLAQAGNSGPDRVVVFKSKEKDLLSSSFRVGLRSTADEIMKDPEKFWSSRQQRKVIDSLNKKSSKEDPSAVEIRYVQIESYEVKKKEHEFEVKTKLVEKTSGLLKANDEILKQIQNIPTGAEGKVVFVILFFQPPPKKRSGP